MKKRAVLLLSLAALVLLIALCFQAGLFAHEDQQPYCLYWDGQLYRSYDRKPGDAIPESAVIGEITSTCAGSKLPQKHGQSNCHPEGALVARDGKDMAVLGSDGKWHLFRIWEVELPQKSIWRFFA